MTSHELARALLELPDLPARVAVERRDHQQGADHTYVTLVNVCEPYHTQTGPTWVGDEDEKKVELHEAIVVCETWVME